MFVDKIKNHLLSFITTLSRYPLVLLFLIAIAIVNVITIQGGNKVYTELLYALIVGAWLSAIAQQIYEQFFNQLKEKVMLYLGVLVLTIGYYIVVSLPFAVDLEIEIKTNVLIFALFIAFIWIPSIKSNLAFDQSFMVVVKAVFTTLLFTTVIALGINLIIFAIDHLLITVNNKVYSHVFNLVLTLFAPIFFLSFIPNYVGMKAEEGGAQQEKIESAVAPSKLFVTLLSYIIVPLAGVYTLILVIYMLLNIRSGFWTDNLLEPMLVAYSITIILITLLVTRIDNQFVAFFKKVIPKVLIPLVLLQVIASILKVGELGLTHGRYYVILFGLFALIASMLFSFFSVRKNGWIAITLIIFSIVSVVPPVDAFTTSRAYQINLLKKTLLNNQMLEDETIIPREIIDANDKRKITSAADYLERTGYTKQIDWLPNQLSYGENFKNTFGFEKYYDEGSEVGRDIQSAYWQWEEEDSFNIEGFDRYLQVTIDGQGESEQSIPVKIKGETYYVERSYEEKDLILTLTDETGESFMRINLADVFEEMIAKGPDLDLEAATFIEENEQARIAMLVKYIDWYEKRFNGEIQLFIEVKK